MQRRQHLAPFAVHMALLLVLAGGTVFAQEPLALYDDFKARSISPLKWTVEQGGMALQIAREVQGAKLRMANLLYGSTASDTGGTFDGTFIHLANPQPVTAIQATFAVRSGMTEECANNPGVTSTRLELHGTFFNTDIPIPGSHTNDVRASVMLGRNTSFPTSPSQFFVQASVIHCADSSCSNGTNLAIVDLGTVRVGKKIRLEMRWEESSNQFVFRRDSQPEVVSPYLLTDTAPPGARLKGILLANFAASCTLTPTPGVAMEATVDNVFLNQSALP